MGLPNPSRETIFSGANADREKLIFPVQLTTRRMGNLTRLIITLATSIVYAMTQIHVVVVVFTLKTVLTSIQYPSLSYSSRQRNEFPWSHANPK